MTGVSDIDTSDRHLVGGSHRSGLPLLTWAEDDEGKKPVSYNTLSKLALKLITSGSRVEFMLVTLRRLTSMDAEAANGL